ncbi:MAG: cation:proton antiporter subunit C [Andreesenia angusta]|nr:cation:proton antiporter subunit C [Andreesenia angusta]
MNDINTVEIAGLALFFIALFGLIARRDIMKSILSLMIMEIGIILYFLGANFRPGMVPPIGDITNKAVADPIPQALVITIIVIGVATTAVTLSMYISMFHRYGTWDWKKARNNRLKDG